MTKKEIKQTKLNLVTTLINEITIPKKYIPGPKRNIFPVQKRINEIQHLNPHIRISLGTKFYLKQTKQFFGPNFP